MSSQTVEFRLLQLVLNPIGDERRTIAMLHWDGSDIRFAWNRSDLGAIVRHAKDDVGIVLDAIHEKVRSMLPASQMRMPSGKSLAAVYPLTEGLSGLLTWSPVRVGQARDPDAHFKELMQLLGLYMPEGKPRRPRVENWVQRRIVALARAIRDDLGADAADRVRVRHPISGIVEVKPPISWLNGCWHHSFPVNFEHASIDSIAAKFQAAFGRIDASVPSGEVGVILSVHPDQSDFCEGLDRVEGFAKQKFGNRLDCMRAPLLPSGHLSISAFEHRVRADISTPRL